MNNIELELLEGLKEVEEIKSMYKFISTYNVYRLLLAHCKNKEYNFHLFYPDTEFYPPKCYQKQVYELLSLFNDNELLYLNSPDSNKKNISFLIDSNTLLVIYPCKHNFSIYKEVIDLEYKIIKINNNKATNIEYQSTNEKPHYYVFYNVDEIINTFAPWDYLYNNEIIITPGYYLNDKLLYYNNIDINDILKIQSIDDISKKIKETRDIKVKTLKL